MKFSVLTLEFDGIIQMLRAYQYEMESQLGKLQKEEAVRIDTLLESITDQDERFVEEIAAGDDYNFTYEIMFPRSHRYSFVVLLFLNLDNFLTRLTDSIKKRDGHPIRANDLKGDIVARSRMYLHRIAKVSEPAAKIWENIEDLSKVRNCIVHTLGKVELSTDQKRIRDIATTGTGLSIGDSGLNDGYLVLESSYCEKAVNDVETLFIELFSKAGYTRYISR